MESYNRTDYPNIAALRRIVGGELMCFPATGREKKPHWWIGRSCDSAGISDMTFTKSGRSLAELDKICANIFRAGLMINP